MDTPTSNKIINEVETIFTGNSSWNLIFIITTFTVLFSFIIILFFPSQNNLILSVRTAVAVMLIGLGLIYTFKIEEVGFRVDYRALFFISLLFIGYGFVFGDIAVWGFSILFLLVSLINVGSWRNEQKWSELSEEVKKVKLVIIFAIMLLLLISIALLHISNKIEDYQAKLRASFTAMTARQTVVFEKKYKSEGYGFNFLYPRNYLFNNNLGRQYKTNNILAEVSLPEIYFAGTNLAEASFMVGVSRNEEIIASCLENLPGEEKQAETKIINDIEYSVFKALEPAAGNRYETTSYRAVQDDSCYEAVELLHWSEITNYPAGAVKEFDYPSVKLKLDGMLNTLKL